MRARGSIYLRLGESTIRDASCFCHFLCLYILIETQVSANEYYTYIANLYLSHQLSLMTPALRIVTVLSETLLLLFCHGQTLFAALRLARRLSRAGDEICGLSVCEASDTLLVGTTTITLTGAAMQTGGVE